MENKEPTKAQREEVWKWCGLIKLKRGWRDNEGNTWIDEEPNLDPTNLFKYAVPKAIDKIMAEHECSSDVAYAILFKKWLQKLELDIPNHEGTLFWTIWEMKE